MSDAIESKQSDDGLLHFQVQGQYGPMTLTFRPLGRHANAGNDITDEQARKLSLDEVQSWYTRNGFPRGGVLRTDHRGRYCGLFQFM